LYVFVCHLHTDADKPFSRRGPFDNGGLRRSFNGSVQHHFHLPEFGKHERPCVFLGAWEEIEAIAILFERERIIAKGGFKTRISRRLSRVYSTIKGIKSE